MPLIRPRGRMRALQIGFRHGIEKNSILKLLRCIFQPFFYYILYSLKCIIKKTNQEQFQGWPPFFALLPSASPSGGEDLSIMETGRSQVKGRRLDPNRMCHSPSSVRFFSHSQGEPKNMGDAEKYAHIIYY